MFRNQYDTDVTVWSPEGRLLQVCPGSCALELSALLLRLALDFSCVLMNDLAMWLNWSQLSDQSHINILVC
jgi:Proteasome subunit A N-terminal signature